MARARTSGTRARGVAGVAAAGLLLGACSSTATPSSHVTGQPSVSISVPLSVVACTTTDSCVALGTTSATGPSSTGEYRDARGAWTAIATPVGTGSVLVTASCWDTGCLVGGVGPRGDLLWRYGQSGHAVVTATSPAGGQSVDALSCYAHLSCALIDSTGPTGVARLSFTTDGGSTWSAPTVLEWTSGSAVSALACRDAADCLAIARAPSSTTGAGASVETTVNGGLAWDARSVPSTWTTVFSLTCQARRCAALVPSAHGTLLATSSTFGRTWHTTRLGADAGALACTGPSRCVAVGTVGASPWLGVVHGETLAPARLSYVPSAFTSVACGMRRCAAVAASTVASLTP